MGINKVQYGNQTLIDLTNDTVTASTLLEGITAHDRSGALITGTLPTPSLQRKSKTYTPSTSQQMEAVLPDAGYDGLSEVDVTVSAMPSMTLPASTSSTQVGTEQGRIFPSTIETTYLNIPSGYNDTDIYYSLRPLMIDSKTITQNGTYVAGDDDLDGFSSVTVNVAVTTVYTGSSAPSSSLGNDGDIYIQS